MTVNVERVRELGEELCRELGYEARDVISVELSRGEARVSLSERDAEGRHQLIELNAEGRKTGRFQHRVVTVELGASHVPLVEWT